MPQVKGLERGQNFYLRLACRRILKSWHQEIFSLLYLSKNPLQLMPYIVIYILDSFHFARQLQWWPISIKEPATKKYCINILFWTLRKSLHLITINFVSISDHTPSQHRKTSLINTMLVQINHRPSGLFRFSQTRIYKSKNVGAKQSRW